MRIAIPRVRRSLVVALSFAAVAALVAIRNARPGPDWNFRVAQRQQLRWMSAYITAYAREHGRPAFYLDSVVAHLDSATAAQFNDYRYDLWGDRVYYWW